MDLPPRLIVFAGLPGTGKSSLARLVAERLGTVWLRVDSVESALLRAGLPRSFETGLAAYLVAQELAGDHLSIGRGVLVDAVNGVEPARRMWRDLESEFHPRRFTVEVTCPDPAEHRRRVEGRAPPSPPLPPPSWDEVLTREYAPWSGPVLVVNALLPIPENVDRVAAYCA